jgi:hypothetical protein
VNDQVSKFLARRQQTMSLEGDLGRTVIAQDRDAQTAHAKAPATDEQRRGVPLIGAMGGAVRDTRPDTALHLMGRRRGRIEEVLGTGLEGIPFQEVS